MSLTERSAELAESAVRHHVTACFATLRGRVAAAVDLAKKNLIEASEVTEQAQVALLPRAFAYTKAVVEKGLAAVIQVRGP